MICIPQFFASLKSYLQQLIHDHERLNVLSTIYSLLPPALLTIERTFLNKLAWVKYSLGVQELLNVPHELEGLFVHH